MPITGVLAVVNVDDLTTAKDFYAVLLGRPADDEPMPSLAGWDVEGGGGLQVTDGDPGRRGRSAVTLVVTDFEDTIGALDAAGIERGEVIDGVVSRICMLQDPCGNQVILAEAPDRT